MLQKFYDRAFVFLKLVEQEYVSLGQSCSEWESLHLRFLLYYLIRFRITSVKDFYLYHFQTAYRLYLDKFLLEGTTLN
ncbi:sigma(X)-activator ComW [Streptococcus oralis]|nr:sigma(X)-activator ComW [Streptococcus oralis]MBW8203499.1 sigma(X)-activator ComW [Streptococcus oralis]